MREPAFCICKNKGAVTAQLAYLRAFVFATYRYIEQSLYFLNPKFQDSSQFILWLHSPVCVRPKDRFPCDAAHIKAQIKIRMCIQQFSRHGFKEDAKINIRESNTT